MQFLDTLAVSDNNAKFNKKLMQNYISDLAKRGELKDWSVSVMSLKQGLPIKVGNLEIYPMNRSVKHEFKLDDGSIESTLRAISTPGEEIIDLADRFQPGFTTTDDIIEPKDGPRKSDTQVRQEFRPRDRGLLMIYPLQSNLDMTDEEYKASREQVSASYPLRGSGQIFAFTFVFPKSPTSSGGGGYMVNPLDKEAPKRTPKSNTSKENSPSMKVLNIAQPNAHSVMFEGKNVENRSTTTNIRGTVAIYASKNRNRLDPEDDGSEYSFGTIVGFADVVDCITKSQVTKETKEWFQGPYGWVLTNIVPLKKPIAVTPPKGAIKWWSVSGEALEKCLSQLSDEQKKKVKPAS